VAGRIEEKSVLSMVLRGSARTGNAFTPAFYIFTMYGKAIISSLRKPVTIPNAQEAENQAQNPLQIQRKTPPV
jgi:hypothetical protein